jgi:hypothetical protein
MTEPLTLTLPELAARWKITPRQVLEFAQQRSLPLYFYFDGLVFDFADKWRRAGGETQDAHALEAKQERAAAILLGLQRQNLHKMGLLKLSQWEDEMSEQAMLEQRAELDRLSAAVEALKQRLAQRQQERQLRVRNGPLRAAPRTLQELATRGRARFPQFAYLPEGGDGQLVALEDGFPLRDQLRAEDTFASLRDIETIESTGLLPR